MDALRRTRVVTRLVVGFLVVSLCVVAIWVSAISATGDIAANISSISAAARVTTRGVQETRTAAEELSAMSRELRGLVGQFRA